MFVKTRITNVNIGGLFIEYNEGMCSDVVSTVILTSVQKLKAFRGMQREFNTKR